MLKKECSILQKIYTKLCKLTLFTCKKICSSFSNLPVTLASNSGVGRFKVQGGPSEFVISGCLDPHSPLYEKSSRRIFTFHMDPTGQLRGSGSLDHPASYAAGLKTLVSQKQRHLHLKIKLQTWF